MKHRKKAIRHKPMLRIFLPLLMLFIFSHTGAQNDTLKHRNLPAVEIYSKGKTESESGRSIVSDTLSAVFQHNLSLAEKLQFNNVLFIKQYGQGTLATATLRGSNAQQVALIWEGVPIQSTLNGTSDLSLIQAELFDNLRIETGPGSAFRGSSAMAGSLTFNNRPSPSGTSFKYSQSISSSGIHRISGNLAHGGEKLQFRLGYSADLSKNNFNYDSLGTNTQQRHAQQNGYQLLPEITFRVNEKNSFYVKAWYLNHEKKLPKLLHQSTSAQEQNDKVLRLVAGYYLKIGGGMLHWSASKITEDIVFKDPAINLNSPSKSDAVYTELNYEKKIGSFLLFHGINYQHLKGKANEIGGFQKQERGALFSSVQYSHPAGKFKTRVHVRQDYFEHQPAPFTPGIQVDYTLCKGIRISGSAARIFRLPTFNDLYWMPGGNRDLKPEKGYTGEGWIELDRKIKFNSKHSLALYLKVCGYTRYVHDLIQWEPNGTYWTAQNVYRTFTRGTESNWSLTWAKANSALILGGSVNYTIATLPDDETVQENLRGKQLIYTPLYTLMHYAGFSWKQLNLFFRQQYTGFRYTSSDNFQYLSPYRLYDLFISKTIQVKQWQFTPQFSIQNLFDESYQAVAQRPMPGRYFQIQINLQYHQHEN